MSQDFPTSRLLVTLGWAKSGEEAARRFTHASGQVQDRERLLRRELRRATRGLKLVIRALRAAAERDEVLPREPVEIMGILIKISDAMLRPLELLSLESETQSELQELEAAVDELDDLVENQQLAAEIPAVYAEVAQRVAEVYGDAAKLFE